MNEHCWLRFKKFEFVWVVCFSMNLIKVDLLVFVVKIVPLGSWGKVEKW